MALGVTGAGVGDGVAGVTGAGVGLGRGAGVVGFHQQLKLDQQVEILCFRVFFPPVQQVIVPFLLEFCSSGKDILVVLENVEEAPVGAVDAPPFLNDTEEFFSNPFWKPT